MFLRKSLKSLQIIIYRQNCLNWCQIVVNRRYLSEDNNGNEDNINNKSVDKLKQNIKSNDLEECEDKVVIAKQHLNQLIDNLKSKQVFGESDPKLKQLLAKPTAHIRRSARKEVPIDDNKDENINEISAEIDKKLVLAAKGIASTLSGDQSKKTENDLLKLLKLQIVETNLAKEGKALTKDQLASLLGDMKVMKEDKPPVDYFPTKPFNRETRSGQTFSEPKPYKSYKDREIETDFQQRGQRQWPSYERQYDRPEQQSVSQSLLQRKPDSGSEIKDKINLFSGEDIGIFEADMKESTESPKMLIWNRLMNDELQYLIAQPPKNAFEEMIQWTEEGKLWKYPINNEQGLEEEEKVPFYEHVLLDHLLEEFPESGPVRKFMELVIIGLSQNPYITVERKHATVQYYRQYFQEKEDILKIAGALG